MFWANFRHRLVFRNRPREECIFFIFVQRSSIISSCFVFFMIYCQNNFYNTEFTLLIQNNSTRTVNQSKGGGVGGVCLQAAVQQKHLQRQTCGSPSAFIGRKHSERSVLWLAVTILWIPPEISVEQQFVYMVYHFFWIQHFLFVFVQLAVSWSMEAAVALKVVASVTDTLPSAQCCVHNVENSVCDLQCSCEWGVMRKTGSCRTERVPLPPRLHHSVEPNTLHPPDCHTTHTLHLQLPPSSSVQTMFWLVVLF